MSDATQVPEDLTPAGDQPPPPTVDLSDSAAEATERGAKRKKENAAKEPKAKRARRSERRTVPDEGFDFLGGAFSAAVRTRVMNLILIAFLVLIGGTLIARAVTAGVATASDNAAADEARQRNTVIQLDLDQRAASGSATISDVDDHIDSRLSIVDTATARELDLPMIFAAANNIAPGARITSIEVGAPPAEAAPAEGEAAEGGGGEADKVSLRGSIALEGQARALNAALQSLPWAEGGAATLNCGAGASASEDDQAAAGAACTWDWSGTLTDEAYSSRSADIAAEVRRPGADGQGGN